MNNPLDEPPIPFPGDEIATRKHGGWETHHGMHVKVSVPTCGARTPDRRLECSREFHPGSRWHVAMTGHQQVVAVWPDSTETQAIL